MSQLSIQKVKTFHDAVDKLREEMDMSKDEMIYIFSMILAFAAQEAIEDPVNNKIKICLEEIGTLTIDVSEDAKTHDYDKAKPTVITVVDESEDLEALKDV